MLLTSSIGIGGERVTEVAFVVVHVSVVTCPTVMVVGAAVSVAVTDPFCFGGGAPTPPHPVKRVAMNRQHRTTAEVTEDWALDIIVFSA